MLYIYKGGILKRIILAALIMVFTAGQAAFALTIAVAGNSTNASVVSIYHAAQIAAEEAGVDGINVVFIENDAEAAEKIKNAGKETAVLGLFDTADAGLISQFPEIPFISLSPDYAALTINANAFRAMISASQMAQALCRADIQLFEKGSFAVLWEEGSPEYEAIASAYADTVRKNNGRLLYHRSAAADRGDYNAILIRIRELKAKVIFYAGSMEQAAKIAKQSKSLNVGAVFTSTDEIYSKKFIKAASPGDDGSEFVTKFPASPYSFKGSRPFLSVYDKRFGWPSGYVPFAYDITKMLIENHKAGNFGIEGIAAGSYSGLTGKISFNQSRELADPEFYIYIIRRKEFMHMKLTPSQRDAFNKAR